MGLAEGSTSDTEAGPERGEWEVEPTETEHPGGGCSCSLGGPDVRAQALPGLPRCTPVLSLFPTEHERRF